MLSKDRHRIVRKATDDDLEVRMATLEQKVIDNTIMTCMICWYPRMLLDFGICGMLKCVYPKHLQ